MTRMWRISSNASRGMTLVEVVCGLALLGTLLVLLLLTKAALVRQRRGADERLAAVEACDRLLNQWNADGLSIPRNGNGAIGTELRWHSEPIGFRRLQGATAEVIRLSITSARSNVSLANVELMQAAIGARRW